MAGANSLTATSGSLTGSPLTFTATGTVSAATQIAINAGNGQSATVTAAVTTPPSVIVRDQFNNPVSGVSVTFAVATGGGTVNPTTAIITNALGIAQVTSWTMGATAGANSLTATSSGLTGQSRHLHRDGHGRCRDADRHQRRQQPERDGEHRRDDRAVGHRARTPATTPVVGVSVTFAVASGGGTVNPTTAITTNASGIAQVTSWTLGTTAGANTLTATSTGLTGNPITFTATGTAGSATQIALNAGNAQSVTVSTAVTIPPSVIVRDVFNNPVAGTSVTFAVASGGGTVNPVTPILTGVNGIAQVTSWTLGAAARARIH